MGLLNGTHLFFVKTVLHTFLGLCQTSTYRSWENEYYGNIGCQVSNGGIQDWIDFWAKINISTPSLLRYVQSLGQIG